MARRRVMHAEARDSAQSATERVPQGGMKSTAGRRAPAKDSLRAVHAVKVVVAFNAEAVPADGELAIVTLKDDLSVRVVGGLRLKEHGGESLADVHREDRAESRDRVITVPKTEDSDPW